MRRALPLSVQLLLTFVGLVVGIVAVLTRTAYTSLLANLEAEASRNVALATRTREQTVTQLFLLRQQRAQGFLASLESFCAEPIGSGRVAWVDDCARTMVERLPQERTRGRGRADLPESQAHPFGESRCGRHAHARCAREGDSHRGRRRRVPDARRAARHGADAAVRPRSGRDGSSTSGPASIATPTCSSSITKASSSPGNATTWPPCQPIGRSNS